MDRTVKSSSTGTATSQALARSSGLSGVGGFLPRPRLDERLLPERGAGRDRAPQSEPCAPPGPGHELGESAEVTVQVTESDLPWRRSATRAEGSIVAVDGTRACLSDMDCRVSHQRAIPKQTSVLAGRHF